MPAYISRGVDKSMQGDYKGAIRDYSIVLQKDPKNTLALLNRGKNKHRLQDYKGAITDFNEAIKTKGAENVYIDLQPNDFVESGYDCAMEEIKLERGISLYFTGDLKKSYSDIQFCLGKNFEREIALYWRGVILISANKKELGCKDLQESSKLGNADASQEIKNLCR